MQRIVRHLDLACIDAAEQLACDEWMLTSVESGSASGWLRTWIPTDWCVVAGYGNLIAREVDLGRCNELGVPVLRRTTGGGAVVLGPGCLVYSLALHLDGAPGLLSGDGLGGVDRPPGPAEINLAVMGRLCAALARHVPDLRVAGDTDLAIRHNKVAGNSQRRLRRSFLFHGVILCRADLRMIADLLPMPSREPEYRAGRTHVQFLQNLSLAPEQVARMILGAWEIEPGIHCLERGEIRALASKYRSREWTLHREWKEPTAAGSC